MEFLELIRMGLFEAFWCFTNPWFNAFAYISVVIGFVIQMICFRKAKTKIGKFIPPIIFFIGCLVCECIAPAFVWMELLAVDIIYCLFVYLLMGAVIALLVMLVKHRKAVFMKKKFWLILIVLLAVLVGLALRYRPVGTVEGPEWDVLHVDGVTYISESSSGVKIPYNRSDRGRHIGIIRSGNYLFHIYEIKGDPERNYLYWSWEWEGKMFIRQDLADELRK